MILVYLLAAVAALIVYAFTSRLDMSIRVVIALLVFAIPVVSITLLVVKTGDKAPPDAVTVHQSNETLPDSERKP